MSINQISKKVNEKSKTFSCQAYKKAVKSFKLTACLKNKNSPERSYHYRFILTGLKHYMFQLLGCATYPKIFQLLSFILLPFTVPGMKATINRDAFSAYIICFV